MKKVCLLIITLFGFTASFAQNLKPQTSNPKKGYTLAECRATALAHHEDMKSADIAARQAEIDRQVAFRQYLPKVDGTALGLYMKDTELMGMTLKMRGMVMAGLQVTEPLYAGGQITAANRLALIEKDVAELQRNKTRQRVIADVDNAYYSLIAVHEKVRMLESYQQQMLALHDDVSRSVGAEMATENDLLRINARKSEIDYQLQKARNGEVLCRLALANAMGLQPEEEVMASDTVLSVTAPQNLDTNIDARPEIALLGKQIEADEQQVKRTRSNYLPTVALTGGYSYTGGIKISGYQQGSDGSYQPFSMNYHQSTPLAMLVVKLPIFHWGAETRKVKKAKLTVENDRLELQKNRRLMSIEARQAVQNLTDGFHMVQTAEVGMSQAEENLRVMRQKYDNQMATMTDLLQAQSQWQQNRSSLIEAKTQYKIYETEYLRVTGKL